MKNQGKIIARDISEKRLNLVEQSMLRLGCTNIELQVKDGCESLIRDFSTFDKILLDAPCTGLGVIRRKPEIKYHSTKEGRRALVKIQEKLLENAVNYLKNGGELLYSTCTVNSDENEILIRKLLKKFPDLKILPDENGNDFTYISPLMDDCDSFFMCLIKK
jgi:16S rRNA (cytosine967-C5)-methyltransferase